MSDSKSDITSRAFMAAFKACHLAAKAYYGEGTALEVCKVELLAPDLPQMWRASVQPPRGPTRISIVGSSPFHAVYAAQAALDTEP